MVIWILNHPNCQKLSTGAKVGHLILVVLDFWEGCGKSLATHVHLYIAYNLMKMKIFPFNHVIFCYYFLSFEAKSNLDRKHMVSFTTWRNSPSGNLSEQVFRNYLTFIILVINQIHWLKWIASSNMTECCLLVKILVKSFYRLTSK